MANLLQIYESIEGEQELSEEEDISFSSPEEALDSQLQIENEVRATMAVGAQLNINFSPNDPEILWKMIELEFKEGEVSSRRNGGC